MTETSNVSGAFCLPVLSSSNDQQPPVDQSAFIRESGASDQVRPGGFELKFHWRILGAYAPVFPGFEIDICDKVDDSEKPDAVWHRKRARSLLRDHPEIKQLFGHSHWTAVWCIGIASAQLIVGCLAPQLPIWMFVVLAYLFGSMANLALFNLAHECNHGLVFKQKKWNRWLFTYTSLPMLLPAHHTWWIEHHVHHNEMGAMQDFVKRRRSILLHMKDRIFGIPLVGKLRDCLAWMATPLFTPIAAFVLITQVIRTAIGLATYFVTAIWNRKLRPGPSAMKILADEHLMSGYRKYGIEGWAVMYPLLSLTMTAVLWYVVGWQSVAYLFLSALFMAGYLHPLAFGLILSNSHFYGFKSYQPTSSYYGWLNWITFNFGLHTEHHDLAAIPWFRLGALRKIAPEYYDPLLKTRSFARLALLFAFGRREHFNNEEYRNAGIRKS